MIKPDLFWRWIFVFCTIVFAPLAQAEQDYGPKYFEPSEQLVTPHIAWAKPYAGERMKVLFITYRQAMREVVEISQRLDMDYEVFAFHQPYKFIEPSPAIHIRGDGMEDAITRLEDKLAQDYDLIVLGGVLWDAMPLVSRAKILQKVKAGTGLVGHVLRKEAVYLNRALSEPVDIYPAVLGPLPYEMLPAFSDHKDFKTFVDATVDAYQFGEGRVVLIKGFGPPGRQMLTPGPRELGINIKTLHYDYYLAFAIRMMQYGAKQNPGVTITAASMHMQRDAIKPVHFGIAGANGQYDVKLALRDRDNHVLASQTGTSSIKQGRGTVRFDLPTIPAGEYFADVWLKQAGRVANFGSITVRVDADSMLGTIDLTADNFSQKQPVTGSVHVRNADKTQRIRVRQYDPIRGLVREVVQAAAADKVDFQVPPHQPLAIVQQLEVALLEGDDVVHVQRQRFFVNDLYPTLDNFQYYIFEPLYSNTFLNVPLSDEMRRMGFDGNTYATYYDRKHEHVASMLALANIRTIVNIYNYKEPHHVQLAHGGKVVPGKHGPMRERCLSDPEYHADSKALYTAEARRTIRFSSIEFNLGDECAFLKAGAAADVCFSPSCLASFRSFLKEEYGSLDAVNASYGTQFADWSDVMPVVRADAEKSPNLRPLWVDHRRHMDRVYANIYAINRDFIREVLPTAQVGYEGSGSRFTSLEAEDHWQLHQSMDLNGPYPSRTFFHFTRDFARPDSRIGAGIIGAYPDIARAARNPSYMTYWPWFSLFQGTNSVWIYEGTGGRYGGLYAVIAPDLSTYDYFENCNQEVAHIKQGIGTLLLNAQREDDGIAVLYSAASNHVGTLTEGFPSLGKTMKSMIGLLEESDYQFRLLSYQQLAEGKINEGKWRLLIMPYSQAISPQEAGQIKQFVRNGGMVLADVRPAVTNQHGKPYETGALDDMFGVRQNTFEGQPVTSRVSMRNSIGKFNRKLAATTLDGSLEVTSGSALGEGGGAPAVIVNSYGKGRAILLNFSMANYNQIEGEWVAKLLRLFFKNLLETEGVERAIIAKPYHRGMHTYRFASGDTQYVGLLHDLPAFVYGVNKAKIDQDEIPSKEPKPITFTWKEARHVYDVRSGTYLGYVNTLKRDVVAGEAQLLAKLPYKVESLTIQASKRIRQGETINIETKVQTNGSGKTGLHVLRVTLLGPDGTAVQGLAADIKAADGRGTYALPIALNQTVGKWTVAARDIATGVSASAEFEVVHR